jgi:phosphopantothenoylcysteine decarboxylase/phosphopantothenate--cysteine ligase
MGFALAAEAARRGAQVLLVAGPVRLPTPPGVERVDVTTAREMDEVLRVRVRNADLIVMAAAVADFRPRNPAAEKIKKEDGGLPVLELEENPDIVAGLRDYAPAALIVGFAAETSRLAEHARAKLERKRLDLLVANDVSRADIGFESEQNEVILFRRDAEPQVLQRRPKKEIAGALLDLITTQLAEDRADAPRAL